MNRADEDKGILHIFPYEKFTVDYANRICALFDKEKHFFLIYGIRENDNINNQFSYIENTTFVKKIGLFEGVKIIRSFRSFRKVILHSLFFSPAFLFLLSVVAKKNRNKLFWNIWGADLYNAFWNRNKDLFHWLHEINRKRLIKNLAAVGYVPSDFEFLKKHYKTQASFYLASYSYSFDACYNQSNSDKICRILIGNSATETSRYLEALDLLKPFKDESIEIWCVLSYPKNEKYIQKVVEKGKFLFGERFHPLLDFVSYNDYCELLSSIDLAVFNHNRQQALGNIAILLRSQKKVFVNKENGCFDYFKRMGATLFSTDEISYSDIKKENRNDFSCNKNIIDFFFSDEQFKTRWEKIFETDYIDLEV